MAEEICGAKYTTDDLNICQQPPGHKGLHFDGRDRMVYWDNYVMTHPEVWENFVKEHPAEN